MSPGFTQVSLVTLASGAAVEQFDHVLGKVLENIQDVNTDPRAKRTIVMTIEIMPNEDRDDATLTCAVSSKVPGPRALSTPIFFAEKDRKPIAVGRDLRQMDMIDEVPDDVRPINRAQTAGRS